MMDHPECSGSVSIKQTSGRALKRKLEHTNYALCILCQATDTKTVYNVSSESVQNLRTAMDGRRDATADRLQTDVDKDNWLNECCPKWHKNCRSRYLLQKNISIAKKRRLESVPSSSVCDDEHDTAITSPQMKTRSTVQQYDAKTMCVICNKIWHKKRRPCSTITSQNREQNIVAKAQQLDRQDLLLRLTGHGHDMVSNDICYHKQCMDRFMCARIPRGQSEINKLYDKAFAAFATELEEMLFKQSQGILMSSLRGLYQRHLTELGIRSGHRLRTSSFKQKLTNHFGDRIAVMEQNHGSTFVCPTNVAFGDALQQLKVLQDWQDDVHIRNEAILNKAAKILRADAKICKKQVRTCDYMNVTAESASAIVPNSFFNFTSQLLNDKVQPLGNNNRISLNENQERKSVLLSQQMLQHTAGVTTPLSIGTSYHIYNQTRSKSLITLNNKLKQGISYDTLQRQLTATSTSIQQQVETEGIYIPDNMTIGQQHVFAMDNLDWKKKTLSGGCFNATTAIVIETPSLTPDAVRANVYVKTTTSRAKTLPDISEPAIPECFVSKRERLESRSLGNTDTLQSLRTESDNFANNLLLLWKSCRLVTTSNLIDLPVDDGIRFPGFPAFCGRLSDHQKGNIIGYLPLIPESQTSPGVLKEEMLRLVRLSRALGHEWTIITGDQATYELATVLRQKHNDIFGKVVLMLGGFHLAHNFVKGIGKIILGSGAEEIIVAAGLCSEGTAKKMLGEEGRILPVTSRHPTAE